MRQALIVAPEEPTRPIFAYSQCFFFFFLIFRNGLAGADDRNAHVVRLQEFRQCVGQQVEAFLQRQPADDAEQWHAARCGFEVLAQQEIALESALRVSSAAPKWMGR